MAQRIRYTKAEDEWILSHAEMSVVDEYKAFIDIFGEGRTLSSFKTRRARINNKGLSHTRYTLEEDEWIKANYPALGATEAFKRLCERFGNRHTIESFRSRRRDLGVNIPKDKVNKLRRENHEYNNVAIGTIVKRGRGQNWIKVGEGTEGWMPLTKYLCDVPEGYNIVHLDGDKANDDITNLRVVSKQVTARMTHNRFWSSNPIITETGILCCELQEALDKGDVE